VWSLQIVIGLTTKTKCIKAMGAGSNGVNGLRRWEREGTDPRRLVLDILDTAKKRAHVTVKTTSIPYPFVVHKRPVFGPSSSYFFCTSTQPCQRQALVTLKSTNRHSGNGLSVTTMSESFCTVISVLIDGRALCYVNMRTAMPSRWAYCNPS
jgi:hypothetical protein